MALQDGQTAVAEEERTDGGWIIFMALQLFLLALWGVFLGTPSLVHGELSGLPKFHFIHVYRSTLSHNEVAYCFLGSGRVHLVSPLLGPGRNEFILSLRDAHFRPPLNICHPQFPCVSTVLCTLQAIQVHLITVCVPFTALGLF